MIIIGVVVAALWLRQVDTAPSADPPPRDLTFTQLTHGEGVESFPTLSPDGRTLAYVSGAAGSPDIYLLRVGGENPINLTADSKVADTQPAFSPDGELIAFRSDRDGGGIFVMGASGESVRRVSGFGYHPAWAADGSQLVICTQSVGDPAFRFTASELWSVDLKTSERKRLADGDAAQGAWSRSGQRIAFWVGGAAILETSGQSPQPETRLRA